MLTTVSDLPPGLAEKLLKNFLLYAKPNMKKKRNHEVHDPVNNPHHYRGNKFECIDIIDDFDLDFCLGNCIKYILRAGKKDNKIEDLKKAQWYLQRAIGQKN